MIETIEKTFAEYKDIQTHPKISKPPIYPIRIVSTEESGATLGIDGKLPDYESVLYVHSLGTPRGAMSKKLRLERKYLFGNTPVEQLNSIILEEIAEGTLKSERILPECFMHIYPFLHCRHEYIKEVLKELQERLI